MRAAFNKPSAVYGQLWGIKTNPLHAATGARGVAQTWKWSALIGGGGN